jgi:hypothetical protein
VRPGILSSVRYGRGDSYLIPASLFDVDVRLQMIAEGGAWSPDFAADQALEMVGFVRNGALTEAGHAYYLARLVARDDDATAAVLAAPLKEHVVVNTFCGFLWAYQEVPKTGAISLIKRLTGKPDDDDLAQLWLDLMKLARLIVSERKGYIRILYNPDDLSSPKEEAERERDRGHVLNPNTPYANRLALTKIVAGARHSIRWYEQHMAAKVLEVLHSEMVGSEVTSVRLLSGPDRIDTNTKDLFQRFQKEVKSERQVDAQWRVLTKEQAQQRHVRVFITEGFSRHLPPLNLILAGTVDEILPSDMTVKDFDEWWALGQDIAAYQPTAKPVGNPTRHPPP